MFPHGLTWIALVLVTPFAPAACVSGWFQRHEPTASGSEAASANPSDPLGPAGENPKLLLAGSPPNASHSVVHVPRGTQLNIPRDALPEGLLPAPGQCSPLAAGAPPTSSPTEPRSESHGSNFQVDPANESPVFIVDHATGQVHSVAQPDDLGAFSCDSLPMSRGYFRSEGTALQEMEHEDSDELITLTGEETGEVNVTGTDLSGWLLRIGPVVATGPAQAANTRANGTRAPNSQLPLPDGFRMATAIETPSFGMDATHAYDRSFIFQDAEPSLMLPAGRYSMVFIRLIDFSMCVLNIEVESGQKTTVSCPPQPPGKLKADTSEPIALMVAEAELKLSGRQLSSGVIPGVRFFGFTGTGPSLSFRDGGQSEWVLDGLFFDFSQEMTRQRPEIDAYLTESQIPSLAVVRNAGELGVPLLVQTRLWPASSQIDRTDTQDILSQVTNGALVRWNSPVPEGSLTEMTGDGSFSFSVSLPPYDLTEYVEIYLNSRLFKRYIVGRRKPDEPLLLTFEERVRSDVDFLITIFTWGKGYLPELIFGQRFLRPRAIHSKICFDVNKNQICDNIDEEGIPSNGFNPLD